MERARHDALAGAVLAGDQDVGVRRPDAGDHLEDRPHRGRLGDEVGAAVAAQRQVLRLEPLLPAQGPAELDLRAQDGKEPRVLPRLLQEVARPPPHRLHRHIDASPGGHHHDGQGAVEGLDARQEIEPLAAGGSVARVVEIDEEGIELARRKGGERRGGGGRQIGRVALTLEQKAKGFQHVLLVVGDQDAAGRALSGPHRGFRVAGDYSPLIRTGARPSGRPAWRGAPAGSRRAQRRWRAGSRSPRRPLDRWRSRRRAAPRRSA